MDNSETLTRLKSVITYLRDTGMSYEEIDIFFEKCIEEGKNKTDESKEM